MSAWSSAGIARTVAEGRIDYNVSFVNGATAIKNLWIVDVIPAPGDGRNSFWRPTPDGTVDTTGTVYYTTQAHHGRAGACAAPEQSHGCAG